MRLRDSEHSRPRDVSIELNGRQIRGSYFLHGRMMITVSHGDEQKTTQLGGLPPETLAKILLRELATARKRGGQ